MIVLTDKATGEVVFDGRRVTRSCRCPVCGKDGWCIVDAARGAAICARVESKRRVGDAGWMHCDRALPTVLSFDKPRAPLAEMQGSGAMQARFLVQGADRLPLLALSLGLSLVGLRRLATGWNGSAWTFPMLSHRREIVGFRTRTEQGDKFAIKGSRAGLFIPAGVDLTGEVFVVEGPTDVAAMCDMGLNAIGRPSCMGSEEEIARCLKQAKEIVIVADADEVGVRGAERLRNGIGRGSRCRVVLPPMGLKDARQVLNHGGASTDWRGLPPLTEGRRSTNGRAT